MCCGGGEVDMPSPDEIGRAQSRFNRIDQWTPYGSLEFGGPNRNMAYQTFSPEVLSLQGGMMGLQQSAVGQLLSRFGGSAVNLQNSDRPPGFDIDPYGLSGSSDDVDPDNDDLDGEEGDPEGLKGLKGPYKPYQESWDDMNETERELHPELNPANAQTGTWDPYTNDYKDIDLNYHLGMYDMDLGEEQARYEQAFMDRARGLLDPVFADQESALNERLANRGMPTGAEETEILFDRFGKERGGAYEKAALDAILSGRSETRADRQQMLTERLGQFGARSQARSQLFGEDTMQFNQLASILGLTQTPSAGGDLSSFFGPGQVDMMSPYALQAQMQQANRGFGSDFLGGLLGLGGSLGGAAIMASDVRLKKSIKPVDVDEVLEAFDGMDVKRWHYISDDVSDKQHIGPMAQEFNKQFDTPSNVVFETIDAVSAIGVLIAAVKALKRRVEVLEGGTDGN